MTTTTTLGRTTTIDHQRQSDGTMRHLSLFSSGLRVDTTTLPSGTTTVLSPEGMTVTSTVKADPRFGTAAPLSATQIRFPSGRVLSLSHSRTATLANQDDMLSLAVQTDRVTVNGRTITTVYDNSTREMSVTTAAGRTGTFRMDAARRPLHVEIPGLLPTEFGYTNGLVTALSRGTRAYSFAYDSRRRLTAVVDPLQRQTQFGYDDADRVVSQTLADGRVIGFNYDATGNLTSVTPPSRPSHTFTFTGGDQVGSYAAPMSSLTRYVYDNDRKLTSVTRPDGSAIGFAYDTAGRLSAVDAPDASVDLTWDGAGRVERVTSEAGHLTYSYDGTLLTGVTASGEVPRTVAYTYDNSLRLESETVNGAAITFGWDADDLLAQAGALSLARSPDNGLLTGTTVGAVADMYTYDGHGDISGYSASYGGTAVYSVTYDRDAIGRISVRAETIAGVTAVREYAYDSAGRLRSVGSGEANLAEYDYDDNSNRTAHRWAGGSAAGDYDAQDRLIAYGGTTFEYTANGDLRSKTLAGATTTYTYDSFGNLRTATLAGGTIIEYVIDAQNRRVGKKVNGTLVQGWVYSGPLRVAAELDGNGAIVSRFVYGSRTNVPDYMIRAGVAYRMLSDHVGSPRLVVNVADGTIAQRIDYDEFGNVLSDTNPGFQPFGFAGGLYDRDRRFLRFGARDYDPHVGRWTAKDPIGFAGNDSNLYGYAYADPINYIDPSGLDALTSDPHALSVMASLFRNAGAGLLKTERSALILRNPQSGEYLCYALPWSAKQNADTIPIIRHPWAVALIHTHPKGRTERADGGADPAAARAYNLPGYVLSRGGIHKFDPGAGPLNRKGKPKGLESEELDATAFRRENGADWFSFSDADACGCSMK